MAGSPFGILKYFEISDDTQVCLLGTTLALMIISYAFWFERWFHELFTKRNKMWRKGRKWWIGLHYIAVIVVMMISMVQVPDQKEGWKIVGKLLPHIPEYFQTTPIFVLSISCSTVIIPFTALILTVVSESLFFTMIILLLSSEQLQSRTLSNETFHLQNTFLLKLHAQAIIPLQVLFASLLYAIFSMLLGYYDQVFNNLLVISAGFHGLASPLVLIALHEEYRKPLKCIRRSLRYMRRNREDSGCHVVAAFQRRGSRVIIN